MHGWWVRTLCVVSAVGCSATTDGYGDFADDPTGIDISGSEADDEPLGDGDGDGDDGDGDGDGDGPNECLDPQIDEPVTIQMLSTDPLDPCVELTFEALVEVSEFGFYGLLACDCDAPNPACAGEKFELSLELPDPAWMPELEVDSCQRFSLYSESVGSGECRRSRIDISNSDESRPWYSVGSAHEDLDHAGLSFTPVAAESCVDGCGEWQVRDLEVSLDGIEQTLGWGQVAVIGDAEIIHWRSWVSPAGCGETSQDRSAWTLRASN